MRTKKILKEFRIENNDNLASLEGLTNLNTISGSLYILDNYDLTSLNSLSNLSTVNNGLNPKVWGCIEGL